MIKRKLIHPRKVVRIMQEFLTEISTLTTPDGTVRKAIVMKSEGFCADWVLPSDACVFRIGYDFNDITSELHKVFRLDFIQKCPMSQGFADITLVLLHEFGHIVTQAEVESWEHYNRQNEIRKLKEFFDNDFDINMYGYFYLPDEVIATQWAIDWLQEPTHRAIAKQFEKNFFACFEKRG